MPRTRVKICGIRDEEIALCAAECGADAIGLVFVKSSPRYIDPDRAWEIASFLPPFVSTVGLFVNVKAGDIEAIRAVCPFDFSQLHGQESEPVVRECGPMVIKAVQFDPATIEGELRRWSRFSEVGAILIDGSAGGEGRALDWTALAEVQDASDHPLILAGGLTPENVGEAIRTVQPWGVDVSSGVERERGVKDPRLIAEFCRAVREADAEMD